MTRKQKRSLIRIIIAGVLFIISLVLPIDNKYLKLAVSLVPFAAAGYSVLWKSVRNIIRGQIFDENFLMSIAALGSFVSGYLSGSGDYAEGTAVMLFYQVGALFESIAVGRSRKSIASLMDIRPDSANLVMPDGSLQETDPEEVPVGSVIAVRAGERIPIDGVVIEGSTGIDTAALTGESAPRDVSVEDEVVSGCVNINGLIKIRTTKVFAESTVSKILEMVESSAVKKSKAESFITRFARYYTPIVVFSALALAVIPSLITGQPLEWINRALIFLVISCPCALVISVPLSFFGGIGGASKQGILIKGGSYLEALAKAEIVVFDKTGTLTHGTFSVTAVHPDKISEKQLLEYAAYAESYSTHPLAVSITEEYGTDIDKNRIRDYNELSGLGISCIIDGKSVLAGNKKLMDNNNISCHDCHHPGTYVHVAVDGEYAGHIVISDSIKPDSAEALKELKAIGIKNTVMLTGDSEKTGRDIADKIGIHTAYCELLPDKKVEIVEQLLKEKTAKGRLLFAGDGINDAPVISRADVGIAMGLSGSDAAIEAADVVLMDDKPSKIVTAIKTARRTLGIAYQNIVFALGIKILVLILGALGLANMWLAVFADVGVSVIAILNAMRCLKIKTTPTL